MSREEYTVLFRVDGGHIPGVSFGHLFRCLGLTEDFKYHNINSVFVMKEYPEGTELVKTRGFEVITMPFEISSGEDCRVTTHIAIDRSVSGIIFDIPTIHQRYLASLPEQIYTVVIDDTGDKNIQPDMLINGSVVSTTHIYPRCSRTEYLLGGRYSILGQHFDDLPLRKIYPNVETVSVFFGGSDPENLTVTVLQSLNRFSFPCSFQIVVGPGFRNLSDLEHHIKVSPNQCVLLRNVENMADCFLQSDIAITAGGRTLYELAATGTPAIVIPSIAHEVLNAEALQEVHTIQSLGMWTNDHSKLLPEVLRKLMDNYTSQQQMSRAGQAAIDGKGRQRIVAKIIQHLTRLKN